MAKKGIPIPTDPLVIDHYLNQDITNFKHIPLEMLPGLITLLNAIYPNTQIDLCTKPCDPGEHVKGELQTHAAYGLYYKKVGCFVQSFV